VNAAYAARTSLQAAELYVSVCTAGSYLDRVRDETGCRRRADLTCLALRSGLVELGPPNSGACGSSDPGRCRYPKAVRRPLPAHRQADETATDRLETS
jgi:hypothetical protein